MRPETFLSGLSAGFACFGRGLWLVLNASTKQALARLDDRWAVVVLLALAVFLLLASFPPGW